MDIPPSMVLLLLPSEDAVGKNTETHEFVHNKMMVRADIYGLSRFESVSWV